MNPRKALMVFGGICAGVAVLLVLATLVCAPVTSRNLKASRTFAEQLIRVVMTDWNADSLRAHASDEFLKSASSARTDEMMAKLGARLGPVRSLGDPQWSIVQLNTGAVVTYSFPATFARAPGTISLRVVQQRGAWKVMALNVRSDSLHIE